MTAFCIMTALGKHSRSNFSSVTWVYNSLLVGGDVFLPQNAPKKAIETIPRTLADREGFFLPAPFPD